MLKLNELYLMDCMEGMKQIPDKYFELAIVDPPYELERHKRGDLRIKQIGMRGGHNEDMDNISWDIKPTQEYFDELFRVSRNQIIWGANNFTLPETEYFIVWDKHQTVDNFASAEYAWTNCKIPAKVFRHSIHQVMQDRQSEGGKIHPTQKPTKLYQWLLKNYAKPGDKILDTHVGSGSSLIACYDLGFDYMGFEIDPDYHRMATERMNDFKSQVRFDLGG